MKLSDIINASLAWGAHEELRTVTHGGIEAILPQVAQINKDTQGIT